MKDIIINGNTYKISNTSKDFLQKYLDKMKNFIEENKIEFEVYNDIEERISERFEESLKKKVKKELSDKIVVAIVNEIGEPTEIFSEMLDEEKKENKTTKKPLNIKKYFSNRNKEITRNSEKGIIAGVCYGIGERYEIDPLWVRLGFIIGTFLWGITVILYIALIILLPDELKLKKKLINKNVYSKSAKVESNNKNNNKVVEKFNSKENKEINYLKVQGTGIFENILRILKKIILFFVKIIKIIIIIILLIIFISLIPAIISLLFLSGIFFTDLTFSNQDLFQNIHLFLKVGLVGILLSIAFLLIGIIGKLLKGKLFSNILILTGVIGTFSFIFIGSVGFFNSFHNYSNTFSKIETFELDNNLVYSSTGLILEDDKLILNEISVFGDDNLFTQGINWIQNIKFEKYNGDKIKVEIISIINAGNKTQADKILSRLNPINVINDNGIKLFLKDEDIFFETVAYSFLRKEIIFYIPENINLEIGNPEFKNIFNISNLYYNGKKGNIRVRGIGKCENTILKYNEELDGFVCEKIKD